MYAACNIREEGRSHTIMSTARNMHNTELADTVFVIQCYGNTIPRSQGCYFWLNCTKSSENFTPCWLLHSSDVTTTFARIWSTFPLRSQLPTSYQHTHIHTAISLNSQQLCPLALSVKRCTTLRNIRYRIKSTKRQPPVAVWSALVSYMSTFIWSTNQT